MLCTGVLLLSQYLRQRSDRGRRHPVRCDGRQRRQRRYDYHRRMFSTALRVLLTTSTVVSTKTFISLSLKPD